MKNTKIPNYQWISTFIVFSRLVGWFMMGWAIYWLLLKLTGHSPTLAEMSINFSFGIATVGSTLFIFLFRMVYDLRKDMGCLAKDAGILQERMRWIEATLQTISSDLKQHIHDTKNRH